MVGTVVAEFYYKVFPEKILNYLVCNTITHKEITLKWKKNINYKVPVWL